MRPYRPTTRDRRSVNPSELDVLVADETFTFGDYTVEAGDAYQVLRTTSIDLTVQGADGSTLRVPRSVLTMPVSVHRSTILVPDESITGTVALADVKRVLDEYADRYADFHPSVRTVADDMYRAIAQS